MQHEMPNWKFTCRQEMIQLLCRLDDLLDDVLGEIRKARETKTLSLRAYRFRVRRVPKPFHGGNEYYYYLEVFDRQENHYVYVKPLMRVNIDKIDEEQYKQLIELRLGSLWWQLIGYVKGLQFLIKMLMESCSDAHKLIDDIIKYAREGWGWDYEVE